MLSPASTETVRATLPVIGAAIDEITPIFYRRMFDAHPDLERDLFNRGNQAQGDQQRALAGAIAAYATVLVDESTPDPRALLGRIAHKHVSLGITADQYEIVHRHLFAAIVQVLGDAVTPEVAAAWDEVYWHMAHDLIAIENSLYDGAGLEPGEVWRPVVVRSRVQESPDTVSFTLAAPDGSDLPVARPGQYISVAVRLPDGARQIRQYSLTRSGAQWEISVKAAGEVSTFLHANAFEGDELTVSAPFGDLVLDDSDDPLVLISAGIGTTPIIGMLNHLTHTASERPVTVLHADRAPSRHAHRQQLKDLVDGLPVGTLHRWYEDLGVRDPRPDLLAGMVDLDAVALPDDAQVYLCGPLPFMRAVHGDLTSRGLPATRIHYEVFGPDLWLAR